MSNWVIRQGAKGQVINHLRSATIPWKCSAHSAVAAMKNNLINTREQDRHHSSSLSPRQRPMTHSRLPGCLKRSQRSCPGPWLWGWARFWNLCLPLTDLQKAGPRYPPWACCTHPCTTWGCHTPGCSGLLRTGPGCSRSAEAEMCFRKLLILLAIRTISQQRWGALLNVVPKIAAAPATEDNSYHCRFHTERFLVH